MVSGGFWLGVPTPKDFINLTMDYLGNGINNKLAVYAKYLVVAAVLVRNWGKDIKKSLFLLSWFLLPILFAYVISLKFTPVFYNRYLLYTIPAAMIILGSQRRKVGNILISIVILFFVVIDFNYFTHPAKIPFRDLAEYVKSTQTENSLIINEDAGSHKLWESKYYQIPAPIYNPTGEDLPYYVGTALMEDSDFISEIPKNITKLGILTYKDGEELKGRFPKYKLLEEKRFGNLNFVWMIKY